jgi:hypothetical protein
MGFLFLRRETALVSDFDYFEDKTENESEKGNTEVHTSLENQDGTDGSFYGDTDRGDGADSNRDAFSSSSFYEAPSEVRERYDEIFDATKPKTVGFSVASMVLGILSVICCCMGWSGLILGALAIVFSIVSRKVLGYFDGMSIAGLIVGKPMDEVYYEEYKQVLKEELEEYNFPILYNINVGHSYPHTLLPLGEIVQIDATNKTLTIVNNPLN